jgi:hypothetical protein
MARGGVAAVWLARFQGKHGFEKLVVVKTILPLYAAEPEFRRMFLDEVKKWAEAGPPCPNEAARMCTFPTREPPRCR